MTSNVNFQKIILRYLMVFSVFLSAFLLFQIQPLIAKYILPWFGGTAAVWTICMLFFQVVLLFGYGYSHLLVARFKPKMQGIIHSIVLASALLMLPVNPEQYSNAEYGSFPIIGILSLLSLTIGMPYFILSTTSSLIQSWYGKLNPSLSPYPLYALSNVGSIIALVSYPVLIETNVILPEQSKYWSIGLACLIFLLMLISIYFSYSVKNIVVEKEVQETKPKSNGLLWFLLAATASILLLSVSDHLSRDVAAVPFIWVLPLVLYLLSFILCFESDRWYKRQLFIWPFLILIVVVMCEILKFLDFNFIEQIILYSALLFVACMLCHGELVKLRPAPSGLTKFYLIVSCGGVMGGFYVGIVAPILFSISLELYFGLFLNLTILAYLILKDGGPFVDTKKTIWTGRFFAGFIGFFIAFTALKYINDTNNIIAGDRNFYGSIRVMEVERPDGEIIRSLIHGTTSHGMERLSDASDQLTATAYYGVESGIGQVLKAVDSRSIKMGMVGLGIGTVATYLKEDDQLKVYEINPQVIEMAYKYFRYLPSSKAKIEILTGDGRLLLEKEAAQNFDVLAIDAFSGDSIPVHLLTDEAIQLYNKHLSKDGLLTIHTSNNYLELRSIIYGVAQSNGMSVVEIKNNKNEKDSVNESQWFILFQRGHSIERYGNFEHIVPNNKEQKTVIWTDDFSNIFSILK